MREEKSKRVHRHRPSQPVEKESKSINKMKQDRERMQGSVRVQRVGKERAKKFGRESRGPMYFFSNSPVRWRLTNVVLPVPPSPTRRSFQVGTFGLSITFCYKSVSTVRKKTQAKLNYKSRIQVQGEDLYHLSCGE